MRAFYLSIGVTAIGDIDTIDDSRLRRKFWAYQREGQCQASVVEHSLRPRALVVCEVRKAVSCGHWRLQAATNHLAGFISLLYVGRAAAEETQGRSAPKQQSGMQSAACRFASVSSLHPFMPQTPEGRLTPGAVPLSTVSAVRRVHNIIRP